MTLVPGACVRLPLYNLFLATMPEIYCENAILADRLNLRGTVRNRPLCSAPG